MNIYISKLFSPDSIFVDISNLILIFFREVTAPDRQNVLLPEVAMGNHPTIDLNVSLSELWPGFQTVLVDVAPSYLVTNSSDLDLVFMGTEDVQYDLGRGQSICPPKLEVNYTVLYYVSEYMYIIKA